MYRMNYQDFVHTHRTTGADITVAALPTDEKQATAFGLMKIDGSGRIQVHFHFRQKSRKKTDSCFTHLSVVAFVCDCPTIPSASQDHSLQLVIGSAVDVLQSC